MDHTFLFHPGLWQAQGIYYDDSGRPLTFSGSTETIHSEGLWFNRGRMEIHAEEDIVVENNYRIVPFREGMDVTSWESENPALGVLIGKFYIVGDSIISTCVSRRGHYSGTEFMIRQSESHYLSRGVFSDGERRLSSWVVDLKKTR
jgi:hypothetical protein